MNQGIVGDVFETLGGVAKSTGQQAATQVKKMGEDVAVELGVKPATQGGTDDSQKKAQSDEQLKKVETVAKQKATARYQQIQADIKAIQEKRKKEIPKQVSGKPGFDEGKRVKQLETGKPTEEKKLPPINVQRERTKAERFRGVSG